MDAAAFTDKRSRSRNCCNRREHQLLSCKRVRFREAGSVRNFERLSFSLPWEGTAFNYDKLLRQRLTLATAKAIIVRVTSNPPTPNMVLDLSVGPAFNELAMGLVVDDGLRLFTFPPLFLFRYSLRFSRYWSYFKRHISLSIMLIASVSDLVMPGASADLF
jgi:hypothetical protein